MIVGCEDEDCACLRDVLNRVVNVFGEAEVTEDGECMLEVCVQYELTL